MRSQNRVDPFEIRPESGLGGRWPIRWRPGTSVEGGTRFWPSRFRVHPSLAIAQKLTIKPQQAAANSRVISPSICFFFKNYPHKPTKKKYKKIEEKNCRSYYRCTWCTYDIKDVLDNHEQTGGEAGCKRPRQRGTDASFTCVLLRSCRDVRRPRHPPNAKTAALTSSRWDREKPKKSRILEIPRPGKYINMEY